MKFCELISYLYIKRYWVTKENYLKRVKDEYLRSVKKGKGKLDKKKLLKYINQNLT